MANDLNVRRIRNVLNEIHIVSEILMTVLPYDGDKLAVETIRKCGKNVMFGAEDLKEVLESIYKPE